MAPALQQGNPGPPGPAGPRAEKGEGHKGEAEPPGPAGPSIMGDPRQKGDHGLIRYPGPPGPRGIGMVGPKGIMGQKGLPGLPGPPGISIQGDKGEKGNQGFHGPKGSTGVGLPGTKGDYGDKGDPGSKGAKGEIGDPGPPGSKEAWGGNGEPGLSREEVIRLIYEICGYGARCRVTPLELVFVIDSSESVRPDNFNSTKTFMKTVIDEVSASHATTRTGITNFSHKVELVSSLEKYTTKEPLKSAVDKMFYLGEGMYTASAIKKAINLFQEARPAVRKVAVVVTDGQADTRDKVRLDTVVREAHAANIDIFVIGIVQETDPHYDNFLKEMHLIATDPDEEHFCRIEDFKTLSALADKLITKICDNVSEIYSRKENVLSPSPEPEMPNEVTDTQLPRVMTSETSVPHTEGIRYPLNLSDIIIITIDIAFLQIYETRLQSPVVNPLLNVTAAEDRHLTALQPQAAKPQKGIPILVASSGMEVVMVPTIDLKLKNNVEEPVLMNSEN
ncbi:collagen alpha-1(XXVIII) chain [Cyrtonyx montezumae]|uniref:collagen alpha-1(XXVIII) chain n=1 Tax=Cyrtonyx montezumae TaxID=9017 RepID=UPI0032DAF840